MPDRPRRRIPGASEPAAERGPDERMSPSPAEQAAERPRARREAPASRANSGWGAVDALATSDGFITPLKVTDDWLLIKFLENQPFDVARQHWFEGIKGQRGWRCLAIDDESSCPLCDELGDTPQAANSFFNVLAFLSADGPTHEVLRAPKGLTGDIKDLAEDSRFQGLADARLYAEVRKKVEGEKRITYQLQVVRARDLPEEWDIEPLSEARLAEFVSGNHTEPISSLRDLSDYRALIHDLMKQG